MPMNSYFFDSHSTDKDWNSFFDVVGTQQDFEHSLSLRSKFHEHRKRTLILLYIGYIALVFCRNDISTLLPQLHFTHEECGHLLFWGNIAYFMGKLTTGYCVDRLGGKSAFVLSIIMASIITFAMSFSRGFWYLASTLGMRRYVQSAAWPALLQIVCLWTEPELYGTVTGILFTSPRVGSALTSLLFGMLAYMYHYEWNHILLLSAIASGTCALMLQFSLFSGPEAVGLPPVGTDVEENTPSAPSLTRVLMRCLCSRRFWLISVSQLCLTLLMEFEYFMPLFMKEVFKLHGGHAAALCSVFSVGCVLSLVIGGWVLDRSSRFMAGGYILCSLLLCVLSTGTAPML